MDSYFKENEEFPYDSENENEVNDDLSDADSEMEDDSDSDEDGEDNQYETNVGVQDEKIYGKDKQCVWYNRPQTVRTHLPTFRDTDEDKVHNQVPSHSIKATFEFFLTDEIIQKVTEATNQRGVMAHGNDWVLTDDVEIRAWIGLHLRAGVNKDNHRPVEELFASKTGPPIYGATMSRERFKILKQNMRFDDVTTREERKRNEKEGKLAPINELFTLFIENCKMNFSAGANVTIDESIVAFNGRCNFKVFMPSKPDRHGIKVWALTDSKTSYLVNAQIYKGKESNKKESGQAERVVKDLAAIIEGSGRNITLDNFFTSYNLSKDLLEKGLTILGTLRRNKKEIPPCLQASRDRVVHSTEFCFSKESRIMLSSYVPKRNKAVIMISSKHYDTGFEVALPHKPDTIVDYNRTKSGVDTLDQLVKSYSCKRTTNRWPLVIFYYMIDIAAYNASVCFMDRNPGTYTGAQRRRKFLMDLSESLVLPLIQRRSSSTNFHMMHKDTRSKIEVFIPRPIISVQAAGTNPRRRCGKCPRDLDRKARRICSKCSTPVCENHYNFICNDCV